MTLQKHKITLEDFETIDVLKVTIATVKPKPNSIPKLFNYTHTNTHTHTRNLSLSDRKDIMGIIEYMPISRHILFIPISIIRVQPLSISPLKFETKKKRQGKKLTVKGQSEQQTETQK